MKKKIRILFILSLLPSLLCTIETKKTEALNVYNEDPITPFKIPVFYTSGNDRARLGIPFKQYLHVNNIKYTFSFAETKYSGIQLNSIYYYHGSAVYIESIPLENSCIVVESSSINLSSLGIAYTSEYMTGVSSTFSVAVGTTLGDELFGAKMETSFNAFISTYYGSGTGNELAITYDTSMTNHLYSHAYIYKSTFQINLAVMTYQAVKKNNKVEYNMTVFGSGTLSYTKFELKYY